MAISMLHTYSLSFPYTLHLLLLFSESLFPTLISLIIRIKGTDRSKLTTSAERNVTLGAGVLLKTVKLIDGTRVSCLLSSEALVLDDHVEGYFSNGITLNDGDTVFDVGANIGIFGIRTLQRGENIRVFAFEPVPTIFACLKSNAELFETGRFTIFDCGISSQAGGAQFTYYPNSPALSTSKPEQWTEEALVEAVDGSIRNPPAHMWYTKFLPSFISKWFAQRMRRNAETFTCELKTISSIISEHHVERIELLKIDCEGAELECLLGIEQSDWKKIQQVVIEVHNLDGALLKVQERLTKMGLSQQVTEQEKALKNTDLFNIFAHREPST
jgi:FkbM family methyltransferase